MSYNPLLTKRALLRGETEKEFHLTECLDDQRLLKAMASDRVIQNARKVLVKAYRQEFGELVKLTNDDVRDRLTELTQPSDL
jgi:hypothetical protein